MLYKIKKKPSLWSEWLSPKRPLVGFLLFKTFVKMLIKQFYLKVTKFSRQTRSVKDTRTKIGKIYDFLKNMSQYNIYVIERSRHCLDRLASQRIKEVTVYGADDIAEVLYDLTFDAQIKINAIYDDFKTKKFLGFDILPTEACNGRKEKVIVASLVGIEEKIEKLRKLGIEKERIVVLQ